MAGAGYRKASGERAGSGGGGEGGGGGWNGGVPRWVMLLAGIIAVLAAVAIVAGGQSSLVVGTWVWSIFSLTILLAAVMVGLLITVPFATRGVFAGSPFPRAYRLVTSACVGLGVLSLAVLLMGALHLLDPPWLIGILLVICAAAGYLPTRAFMREAGWGWLKSGATRGSMFLVLAAAPIAVMLIAASFPAGTLWRSEANAYDARVYHLELPREYAAANRIAPVAHNVYSYFPSNVEMLYLLAMQLARTGMHSADYAWGMYPAQFLHALMMLLTALAVYLAPVPLGPTGRAVAAVAFLSVPWTLVTGSLAYDEAGMLLAGSLAISLSLGPARKRTATGALIGILIGLAVGSKLTAGIFFAAPLGIVLLLRAQLKQAAIVTLLALAVYSPWAIRAAIASGGNPVFPFATSALGRDSWTDERIARFTQGHAANQDDLRQGRWGALVRGWFGDQQWSPGWASVYAWAGEKPPDIADGAWKYVGLMWWVLPLAIVMMILRALRNAGSGVAGGEWEIALILLLQIAGWMLFTHLQPRFLLPTVVPLALILGMGANGLGASVANLAIGGMRVLICTVVGLQAVSCLLLLLPESGLFLGARRDIPPIGQLVSINVPALLQPGAESPPPPGKLLLIGLATAYDFDGAVLYATVFDDSPLSEPLRRGEILAWLQREGIDYIVADWHEVARLRRQYGYDDAVTPEALEKAGLHPQTIEGFGATVYPVPKR